MSPLMAYCALAALFFGSLANLLDRSQQEKWSPHYLAFRVAAEIGCGATLVVAIVRAW